MFQADSFKTEKKTLLVLVTITVIQEKNSNSLTFNTSNNQGVKINIFNFVLHKL